MSTLITHSPKFQSKLSTLAQIAALPTPARMGPWHKPIPHHELIGTILQVADKAGLKVSREQFALGSDGKALFGVLDFVGDNAERSTSLGFRNSTDQSLALQAVAGSHVFVCDNLALSGEFETWARKNTTGLNLVDLVTQGFDKFQKQAENFDASVLRLSTAKVSDDEAKSVMWDVFAKGILPSRLIDDVDKNFFRPDEAWTDCQPRTKWGLHNALTRAARDLSPTRLIEASTDLGKVFGIGGVLN